MYNDSTVADRRQPPPDGTTWGNWCWNGVHETLEMTTVSGTKFDFGPLRPDQDIHDILNGFEGQRLIPLLDLLDLETALHEVCVEAKL